MRNHGEEEAAAVAAASLAERHVLVNEELSRSSRD